MKRVSVIVPCYNSEKLLRKCVNSIICQLSDDDELLLINDGSTDSTEEICREYEQKCGNVRYIGKQNEGNAKTRNLGIEAAVGRYICFIDHDDSIDSGYIRNFYEAIEKTGADMVIGGYRKTDENGKTLAEQKGLSLPWYPYMFITPWGRIINRQFLIDNNIRFYNAARGEDLVFNITICAKTDKISSIEYVGYNWLQNSSSVSHTAQRCFSETNKTVPLLESLKAAALSGSNISTKLFNYYLIKEAVFSFFLSGRGASYDVFMEERKCCFDWLKSNDIKLSFPLFGILDKSVNASGFMVRLVVNLFLLLHKTNLMPIFAKLYCKGTSIEQ